jgi:hypothetical protein
VFDSPSYPSLPVPFAAPPPPSPCDRLSRLRVLWGGLTPAAASRHLASWFSVATAPCRTRTAAGLPSSRRFSLHMPRAKDPGAVTGRKLFFRVLVAGFHVGNHVALRMMLLTGLNRFRGVHPSCGLRSSLCTLTLLHSAFPFLFHSANTRYEWMASPYPAGTRTPQEAPSFAWRTTDKAHDKAGIATARFPCTTRVPFH